MSPFDTAVKLLLVIINYRNILKLITATAIIIYNIRAHILDILFTWLLINFQKSKNLKNLDYYAFCSLLLIIILIKLYL